MQILDELMKSTKKVYGAVLETKSKIMIMKKLIYLLLLLLTGTALHAQRDTIKAAEAQKFVGKTVLLCDRVNNGHMDNISKDEPTIVYVGDTY